MKKLFRYAALTAGLFAVPAGAGAGELKLTIADGRVTLVAHDVPVREILAEWSRIGQTKILNGEKLIGPPVTLELEDVPEAKALETILRSAAGYVVAPRITNLSGPSSYESIAILATSRAPAVTQAPPAAFVNRPAPQPMMPQVAVDDDDDTPETVPAPGQVPGQGTGPAPVGPQFPGPPTSQFPGASPMQNQQPGGPQAPMTLPRPGQLPQPPVTPGNPYVPGQSPRPNPNGVPRPGGGSGGN